MILSFSLIIHETRDSRLWPISQDAVPKQSLPLARVGVGALDVQLRRIVVADKGANLLAKRIVVRREPQIHCHTLDCVSARRCNIVSFKKIPVKQALTADSRL